MHNEKETSLLRPMGDINQGIFRVGHRWSRAE